MLWTNEALLAQGELGKVDLRAPWPAKPGIVISRAAIDASTASVKNKDAYRGKLASAESTACLLKAGLLLSDGNGGDFVRVAIARTFGGTRIQVG
jgi:hypothetical protein